MAEPKAGNGAEAQPESGTQLTKADVAKLVKRAVPALDKEGKPTGKTTKVNIEAAEVFDFAVRDDGTVVVVTVDGQKFFGSVK
jgi:hypothetical protein